MKRRSMHTHPLHVKLWNAQQGQCFYCRERMEPKRVRHHSKRIWTVDHFIPRAQYGTDRWNNKVLACRECNNRKADGLPTSVEAERFRDLMILLGWTVSQDVYDLIVESCTG